MAEGVQNRGATAPIPMEKRKKAMAAEARLSTGDPQAEADLAEFYMFLGNTLEQADPSRDYDIALTFAESAAVQGNGDGIFILAQAYEYGYGVEANPERALELYRKGAAMGHAASGHSFERLSRQEFFAGAAEDNKRKEPQKPKF